MSDLMREVEITKTPELDLRQQRLADIHSLLNVLNVISLRINTTALSFNARATDLYNIESKVALLAQALHISDDLVACTKSISEIRDELDQVLESLLEVAHGKESRDEVTDARDELQIVFKILRTRFNEFALRRENPHIWVTASPNTLIDEIQDIFRAIERNAHGQYRIRFDAKNRAPNDYLLELKISSELAGNKLWMPLLLKDIIRDLLANARKYTSPGGEIKLDVLQDETSINCSIGDTGIGIPDDEIQRVSEFGYRASNTSNLRTLGGGFGLTKASWLILNWGGRFFIKSKEKVGTQIRFQIPNKPQTLS